MAKMILFIVFYYFFNMLHVLKESKVKAVFQEHVYFFFIFPLIFIFVETKSREQRVNW